MAGIITKLREKVGLVIVVIGFSMVAFILTDLFKSGSFLFYSDVIGEARGEKLKYNDFRQMVERQIAIQEQQQQRPLSAEEREQVVNQVWNQWINDVLFKYEATDAGISVSEDELVDMFLGERPHQEVVRLFTGGGKVQYDRNQVRQILQQANQNPEIKFQLKLLEEYLLKQRTQEKLFGLIQKSVYVPKPLAEKLYYEQSEARDIEFLAINYASVPNDVVTVTEGDYSKFYRENKERFKQTEIEAGIHYIRFDKKPSKEDSLKIRRELEKYRKEWIENAQNDPNFNDSLFAVGKSDVSPAYMKVVEEQLNDKLKTLIDSLGEGNVSEVFLDEGAYRLVKFVGKKKEEIPPVHIKHILLAPQGNSPQDSINTVKLADSLAKIATTENFANLVGQYSQDRESAMRSGDLGWYYPGMLGKDFDEAMKNAKKGEIIGPIKSPYGYHIVEIVDVKDAWLHIAIIAREIHPSSETIRSRQRKAMEFIALLQESNKDLKTLAGEKGYNVRIADKITPTMRQVPGFKDAKELTRWALLNEEGAKTQELIDLEEAFVVAQIYKKVEEGYKPLKYVKQDIETEVLNLKKAEYIVANLNTIQANSIQDYKQKYTSGGYKGSVYSSVSQGITFNSAMVKGVGNDPILMGAIFGLPENTLSKPIAAKTGVYIVKVTKINKPQAPKPEGIQAVQMSTMQIKQQVMQGKAYNGMREYAEIKDFRFRFGY